MLLRSLLSLTIAQAPLDAERAPTSEDQTRAHEGCKESEYKLDSRRVRVGVAFGLAALALDVTAIVLPLATRTKLEGTDSPTGPTCTAISKPCGNTCISLDKMCDVGAGTAGYETARFSYPRGVVLGSVLLGFAGLAMAIAAFVVPRRMERRRVDCSTAGCSLAVRF
jgi:hypothetical protein